MPSHDALFNSARKVFAHYIPTFPLSIDNETPSRDYYNTQYLNKDGESGKWLAEGGFIRQRPLAVEPSASVNWRRKNMESEVTSAVARGITGFTFDVMSLSEATDPNSSLHTMLAAAQAADSRFKVVVMPDITALKGDANAVVAIVSAVATSPAAYRTPDGRLVVSAFDADINPSIWWESVLAKLSSKGIEVAFVPTFGNWQDAAAEFSSITYGFGDWGSATPSGAASREVDPALVHSVYKKIFMMPIDSQQFRPKDFLYWEAGNSEAFRNGWLSAIRGGSDWVQVVTWNDFSESGEVSPYTDATLDPTIGTGYYDLNGYYAAWFITGQQPTITHDVLYYFYRREPTNAAGHAQKSVDRVDASAATDNIELVALLTAPGTIEISINGKTYAKSAAAGLTTFTVVSKPGVPIFKLSRAGSDVFAFKGGVQIYGASGLPTGLIDMTYMSGSASKSGVCAL